MSIYKKLQEARVMLHKTKLDKSGRNKFANFNYFELGDFIPQVTDIFNKVGLCGIVSFTQDTAYLTIHEVEGEGFVTFTSPLVYASVEKTQPIQNLGSTHTYLRRYLWLMAMEIVENDVVDAVEQKVPVKKVEEVKPVKVEAPKQSVPATLQGKEGDWQLKVLEGNGDWGSAVKAATSVLLQFAKDETDVQNIFKTNRTIYDKLKAEHEQTYAEIMATFKATKEALTKE